MSLWVEKLLILEQSLSKFREFDYLTMLQQHSDVNHPENVITRSDRQLVIHWIYTLISRFNLKIATIMLTIDALDALCCAHVIPRSELFLNAAGLLIMSSKVKDIGIIDAKGLVRQAKGKFQYDDVVQASNRVVEMLDGTSYRYGILCTHIDILSSPMFCQQIQQTTLHTINQPLIMHSMQFLCLSLMSCYEDRQYASHIVASSAFQIVLQLILLKSEINHLHTLMTNKIHSIYVESIDFSCIIRLKYHVLHGDHNKIAHPMYTIWNLYNTSHKHYASQWIYDRLLSS